MNGNGERATQNILEWWMWWGSVNGGWGTRLHMASSTLALTLTATTTSSYSYLPKTKHTFSYPRINLFSSKHRAFSVSASASASSSPRSLQALIFDCDGVILESEHLHRQAYNDAFIHFNVRCPSSSSPGPLDWDVQFYDELQNLIGGGKPKMRWFLSFLFSFLFLYLFTVFLLIIPFWGF